MTGLLKIICLITLTLPISAQASIYISEIAWMGGLSSANHEWIELHKKLSAKLSGSISGVRFIRAVEYQVNKEYPQAAKLLKASESLLPDE